MLVDLNEERGNVITGELGKQSVFVKADVTSEGVLLWLYVRARARVCVCVRVCARACVCVLRML